jgi:hypothetical protein
MEKTEGLALQIIFCDSERRAEERLITCYDALSLID